MKAKHIIFIIIAIIALLLIMIPKTQAGLVMDEAGHIRRVDEEDTNEYSNDILNWTVENPKVPTKVIGIIGAIIAILRNVSIIITVVVITILGVKYMIGSVEEKADYKKDYPNIIIGVILVAGITSIISVIFSAAEGIL